MASIRAPQKGIPNTSMRKKTPIATRNFMRTPRGPRRSERLQPELVLDVAPQRLDRLEHPLRVRPEIHLLATFLRNEHPRLPQHPDVMRHRGPRQRHLVHHVLDRALVTLPEHEKDPLPML